MREACKCRSCLANVPLSRSSSQPFHSALNVMERRWSDDESVVSSVQLCCGLRREIKTTQNFYLRAQWGLLWQCYTFYRDSWKTKEPLRLWVENEHHSPKEKKTARREMCSSVAMVTTVSFFKWWVKRASQSVPMSSYPSPLWMSTLDEEQGGKWKGLIVWAVTRGPLMWIYDLLIC